MRTHPIAMQHNNFSEPAKSLEPQFDITAVLDGAFHIFCSQIAENYLQILRKHVLPNITRKSKLGLRELRVLNCIFRFKGDMASRDIVEIMAYDPATVSRAITRLCDEGMVVRSESDYDGRTTVLTLTELGEELAKEYRGKALHAYELLSQNMAIDISSKEVEVFLSVAEKIRDRTTVMRKTRAQKSKEYEQDLEDNYTNVLKMSAV